MCAQIKHVAASLNVQFLHLNSTQTSALITNRRAFTRVPFLTYTTRCEVATRREEPTKSQHRLVDFAGCLLAQESRVVTLDRKQSHDA